LAKVGCFLPKRAETYRKLAGNWPVLGVEKTQVFEIATSFRLTGSSVGGDATVLTEAAPDNLNV